MFVVVQPACSSGSSSTQRWQADHSYSHMAPTGRPQRKHAVFLWRLFALALFCSPFWCRYYQKQQQINDPRIAICKYPDAAMLQRRSICSKPAMLRAKDRRRRKKMIIMKMFGESKQQWLGCGVKQSSFAGLR